jgi:hypothetical protein
MCDPLNILGTKFFHYINKENVENKARFKPKEKFAKKFLVWQAIDECGNVSEPYIKVGSMKAEKYRTECLEDRLIPFMDEHHKREDVLFWPYFATIHYQKDVQQWLQSENLNFVSKTDNPPNVPQARPIEKF